ncbi:MAG: phenylalanine--tRNA ligase subunit beta [Actinomycetota bacterium]|nr:phenylalanine--tRNA ligase subunit beta [Actinomycetota bacterium]
MRVNLRWLGEYVHVDVPLRKLVELLSMSGLKVEAIHGGDAAVEGVVVAEIVQIDLHPDADNLALVEVRTNDADTHRVVVGVRNYEVGDRVPLATVGARLGEMKIAERKIRGQVSQGMLCSPMELQVSKDHSGIMVLPADAPLGEDVATLLDLDATVLELEVTPNRPDCMGMIGVAREVAALLGNELKFPDASLDVDESLRSPVNVEIKDAEGCPRYVARYIEGVTVGPSSLRIAKRILSAGTRPISNLVDATNYVMLETGQPLHAFDAAQISQKRIVVRKAGRREQLVTLDGVERELHPDDLLIADPSKVVAMAGLMGGEHSEVSDSTTAVILESACFDTATIAYMSRRHLLRTEASARFERGTDPEAVAFAAARACKLMADTAGGRVSPDVTDSYPIPFEKRQITLRPSRINALIGLDIRPDLQARKLRSIGLDVTEEERNLNVTIPSFRRDLKREVDLVEEVARLVGFDSIRSTIPPGRSGGLESWQAAERRIKSTLAGLGVHEAWTPAFMSSRELDDLGLPDDHPGRALVRIANPMTENEEGLRTTLLPGLLRSVARNVARQEESVALFELARVYEPTDRELPQEAMVIGAAFTGDRQPKQWNTAPQRWDFYAVKGVLQSFLGSLGVPEPSFFAVSGPPFHLTRATQVRIDQTVLGAIGDVHPDVCEAFAVPEGTVAFEIALAPILAALPGRPKVEELPKFPPIFIDIAVIVPEKVEGSVVEGAIREFGAPEVTSVRLFDLYRGGQIPEGYKSLAYALELRDPEKTLTDDDAAQVRDRVMSALSERTGARLRA